VEAPDGRWVGFEVKLGGQSAIDQAVANLSRLRARLTDDKWSQMVSLNIITAGSTSFRRDDGIQVVALGHLTS